MKKSVLPQGTMFVCNSSAFPCSDREIETQVWVKVDDEKDEYDGYSRFINNRALVRISSEEQDYLGSGDMWLISDDYYNNNVEQGQFVPIDDLRETESICKEKGWPDYEMDLGF